METCNADNTNLLDILGKEENKQMKQTIETA
jgi:hypothetical protein